MRKNISKTNWVDKNNLTRAVGEREILIIFEATIRLGAKTNSSSYSRLLIFAISHQKLKNQANKLLQLKLNIPSI